MSDKQHECTMKLNQNQQFQNKNKDIWKMTPNTKLQQF